MIIVMFIVILTFMISNWCWSSIASCVYGCVDNNAGIPGDSGGTDNSRDNWYSSSNKTNSVGLEKVGQQILS